MFSTRYWWDKNCCGDCKNGEIEQRQQIHTPRENVVEGMHQALGKLLADYEGQFDYVAVASTGIINNGILSALNPKT